jgi:N6-L-threonylcarbamoyladenine synthase
MRILAIETSCDETCAAVVEDGVILSNIVWSSMKLHAKWGGVVPSIAKRAHEERIDEVVEKALRIGGRAIKPDYVAITVGLGLAIALEVGIKKAKELSKEWSIPLVEVNHVEGHILSALNKDVTFPALGLIISGGTTELVFAEKIGKYKIIASTADDALGEALDKGAKMLGLGYPGGPVIEKMAKRGDENKYEFTLPFRGRESEGKFSYSGLKSALFRLTEKIKGDGGVLSKKQIEDLSASYQKACFEHLTRVVEANSIPYLDGSVRNLLVGGGVVANLRVRKELRKLAKKLGLKAHFPINKKLCGDNAGMIGLAGYFKAMRGEIVEISKLDQVDRRPRWKVDES